MAELPVTNKTLKLTNVMEMKLQAEDLQDAALETRLESYIRSKGTLPLGPLVQYSGAETDEAGEADLVIKLLRQANTFVHHTEEPYRMTATLRVPNCLYVRYTGPEEKLGVAYEKLHVVAFENDIELKGSSYTVFVNRLEDGDIVADVFMERKE